jgi:protein-arginine deiminase
MHPPDRLTLAALALCGAVACTSDRVDGGGGDIAGGSATLVVDANRDGELDLAGASDEEGKAGFDAKRGAVFLANLDDDDENGEVDADSDGLDGDADTVDLAPIALRPWAGAPSTSTGTIKLDDASVGRVRLFRVDGDAGQAASYSALSGAKIALTAGDLKSGVRFAIEALDVVTSKAKWDGTTKLTLEVKDKSGKVIATDAVQLRVAPVLFQFNTAATQQAFWTNLYGENQTLVTGVKSACGSSVGAKALSPPVGREGYPDQWTQDFFDIGYTSRPGPGGEPVGMKIALRSAQPERSAGGIVWSQFLGPDFGAIEIADPKGAPSDDSYSMNSFGNWDVIPPYTRGSESFPLGRNIWGSGEDESVQPDQVFSSFVRAQGVQPPITVDTSWLIVGHVDEIISFVKAETPRGWAMLVASPRRAREMLLDLQQRGYGSTKLFVGREFWDFNANPDNPPLESAAVSIDDVLKDTDRLAVSDAAQQEIDDAIRIVKNEVGLDDSEIIEMPFLFEEVFGKSIAYQPGTVNLLHVDDSVVVPKPFGPRINNKDPFEEDAKTKLGGLGLNVIFADDWDVYHINMGEVHCGTNVSRNMNLKWWESGR